MCIPFGWSPSWSESKEEPKKKDGLKCGLCGSKATYVGMNDIHCTNSECKWYKADTGSLPTQEGSD